MLEVLGVLQLLDWFFLLIPILWQRNNNPTTSHCLTRIIILLSSRIIRITCRIINKEEVEVGELELELQLRFLIKADRRQALQLRLHHFQRVLIRVQLRVRLAEQQVALEFIFRISTEELEQEEFQQELQEQQQEGLLLSLELRLLLPLRLLQLKVQQMLLTQLQLVQFQQAEVLLQEVLSQLLLLSEPLRLIIILSRCV